MSTAPDDEGNPANHRFPWHYRRSLASRVTLLSTFAVAISVTFVALAAYIVVRQQSIKSLDDSLEQRAIVASNADPVDVLSNQTIPSWALGAANAKLAFIVDKNRYLSPAGDDPLPIGKPEFAVADRKLARSARTVEVHGVDYRAVAVPVGSKGEALVLAQSLQPTERTLDRLGLVMLLVGLVGVITAALAGWAVALNGLRPVRRLTFAVEGIARTERLTPIEVEGKDEIARLAMAFNQMLASLSASQVRQRQLVADAGHELRTPLTSLRTNLDLLIQAEGSDALTSGMRQELMTDVRAQIDELTTLIGDLTELAREAPAKTRSAGVDLAEVLEQALRRVRLRAPSLEFDVQAQSWWLVGDAQGLERAVTNLLDNAAKWSPERGVVSVTLADGVLTVADQGPGIAAEDLPHVFDRFYRATESRGLPGSGLGLAIVRAVAERHDGRVEVGNVEPHGAVFWFTVPGSSEAPAED